MYARTSARAQESVQVSKSKRLAKVAAAATATATYKEEDTNRQDDGGYQACQLGRTAGIVSDLRTWQRGVGRESSEKALPIVKDLISAIGSSKQEAASSVR